MKNPRIRIGDSGREWAPLIGGGVLAIYGLSRRSLFGVGLAAAGGTIALLGANQKTRSRNHKLSAGTTILVNCSPQEAYQFWRDFENLPRFMNRLRSVTVLDSGRSRWVALGPMGRTISWDAEITSERENEHIAWHSLPGSDVQVDGRVEFKEAPAGRGTLIGARLEFGPIAGGNTTIAKFLEKGAKFAMRQDMRRLEALMESGEIPTTDGQSHGPRDAITAAARMIDPTRPIAPESDLTEVFEARRRVS